MTETGFDEPARLSTPTEPLFSLKPLDATTWLIGHCYLRSSVQTAVDYSQLSLR